MVEARTEHDLVKKAMGIVQVGSAQPNLEEDAIHFTKETDPDSYLKL
jgi:hypothetical protein